MRLVLFLVVLLFPSAIFCQAIANSEHAAKARLESIAEIKRDYPTVADGTTPLGAIFTKVIAEWQTDPSHQALLLETDAPELVVKEAAHRTALQLVRNGTYETYDQAFASLKAAPNPSPDPTSANSASGQSPAAATAPAPETAARSREGVVEHTYEFIQDYTLRISDTQSIRFRRGDRYSGRILADHAEIDLSGVSYSVPRNVLYAQPRD